MKAGFNQSLLGARLGLLLDTIANVASRDASATLSFPERCRGSAHGENHCAISGRTGSR